MNCFMDFEALGKDSVSSVGGKNASLGEMIRAGILVPPGFAVTTDGFLGFITETGVKDRIYGLLSDLDPGNLEDLNARSAQVQDMLTSAKMPAYLREAISDRYARFCTSCAVENLPVAVRSSATAEDLPTASFAGQQDTYLWVQGSAAVTESVQRCWASLFTPRAVSYRIKNGFDHAKVLISVGVQKMVNSKAAGVMFTLNPVNGDLSKVVIEGNWGLGETVVSGSVTPDKFVVDKVVMETSEKTISKKHIQCVYDPDKDAVINSAVDESLQSQCCLSDSELKELVRLAKAVEMHYGRPMDIEWAIDRDRPFPQNMFIVQARPETVWSQRQARPVIGRQSGFQLLMQQAMQRIKIEDPR